MSRLTPASLLAVIMFNAPVQRFVMGSMAFQITFALLPLVGERPPNMQVAWLFCQLFLASPGRRSIIFILTGRAGAGLIPLFIYSRKHPHNLIILAAWVRMLPAQQCAHAA